MEEKLRCPRASERKTPPQNDELIDPECGECPLLMREVDERGVISLYCLVYRNRFRSSNPSVSVTARPPSAATWRRESRST
jgi:hypothetical protein